MSTHPRLAALTVALAATLTLAACSATPGPGSTETSEGDGALTLYSGRDEELVQPLIDLFEEESGIEVEVRYGNTPELAALLLEEGENTPAQVFLSQDAGALGALSSAGLFTELLDELADSVQAGFTSEDGSWLGVTGRARVIAYDSQEFSEDEVPDSVDAFTEPEWSGRFGIAPTNASFQAFVTAYRVLEGEEAADAWLAGIAANSPQIFENNRAILAAVNDGQLDAGLLNHYYWYGLAAEAGAENLRAALKFPEAGDPGSIVNVAGAGILSGADGDSDALAFLEFLVSEEAQEYFVEETFEYPLVAGVDAPEGLPALDSLVNSELDLSDLESLEETQRLLAEHGLL